VPWRRSCIPTSIPGIRQAEEKFKQVSAAYDLVGDAETNGVATTAARSTPSGNERPRERYYRDFQEPGAETHSYSSNEGYADFMDEDVLREMFSRSGGGARFRARRPGRTLPPAGRIPGGGQRRHQTHHPAGWRYARRGHSRRHEGQAGLAATRKGRAGIRRRPAGDALVEVEVQPHKFFTRDGDDIRVELPISLPEAVLGGSSTFPTPTGSVRMTVPKGRIPARCCGSRAKARGAATRAMG
jgi:DnaJ-class molecular chaperone